MSTENEALLQAIWTIQFAWPDRGGLRRAEAKALLDAYFDAKMALSQALIDAKRFADDASAQRSLIDELTKQLENREQRD